MTPRKPKEPSAETALQILLRKANDNTSYWDGRYPKRNKELAEVVRRALRRKTIDTPPCTCEQVYSERDLVSPRCTHDDPVGHARDLFFDRFGKKRRRGRK